MADTRVVALRGSGASALRDAIMAGVIAPDVEADVIRTVARNEALEHENHVLWELNRSNAARLNEHRQTLLARCGWKAKKTERTLNRDQRLQILIAGFTLGCMLSSLIFCGTVVAGWFW